MRPRKPESRASALRRTGGGATSCRLRPRHQAAPDARNGLPGPHRVGRRGWPIRRPARGAAAHPGLQATPSHRNGTPKSASSVVSAAGAGTVRPPVLTLAFDTATDVATVALVRDGEVLGERRSRAVSVLADADELLRAAGVGPADLGLLAVGVGPGSFTGVRMGLAA